MTISEKIFKKIGKGLLILLILFVVVLLLLFLYNKIMLSAEESLLEQPIGQMVEVDGHNMNVYIEGDGNKTLVFLSGSGTASPVLDFKSLYSLLSDYYRIVVIEKFGYGFSDVVDTERSFDTMLAQDRKALAEVGVDGPFILCPHSMSGLEAILWAQKYPEEVSAIVGLDMALPRAYDAFDLEGTLKLEKFATLGRELGVVRLFYLDGSLPDGLTKEEKKIYRAIASKIAVNEVITNEGLAIPDAVREIDSMPKPNVPTIMFVSDGKEVGIENWAELQREYASDLTRAQVVELGCGHYVHHFEEEKISENMRKFIEE